MVDSDNSSYPIAKVKSLAGEATFVLSPGEPWPAEGGTPPNPDSSSSASSSSTTQGSGSGTKLSAGAIAGIVIGGVIALALIGLLFFFVGRKKGTGETKTGAQTANFQEAALMNSQTPGSEHPPLYQDPRYSVVPAAAPVDHKATFPGAPPPPMSENPNRMSELPAANYNQQPVEIYTAGPEETPAHRSNHSS